MIVLYMQMGGQCFENGGGKGFRIGRLVLGYVGMCGYDGGEILEGSDEWYIVRELSKKCYFVEKLDV